ncbi:MAG: RyR domain-containing protein [Caulobacterales bacterium]
MPPRRSKEEIVHICAQVAHEAMRAFKIGLGEDRLAPWSRVSADVRRSTIEGVRFRIANPDAPLSAQHDQWMAERIAAGWRKGKVKDVQKKTHPSLVPYEALSETERRKDALIASVVKSLAGPL